MQDAQQATGFLTETLNLITAQAAGLSAIESVVAIIVLILGGISWVWRVWCAPRKAERKEMARLLANLRAAIDQTRYKNQVEGRSWRDRVDQIRNELEPTERYHRDAKNLTKSERDEIERQLSFIRSHFVEPNMDEMTEAAKRRDSVIKELDDTIETLRRTFNLIRLFNPPRQKIRRGGIKTGT